jgi:hypothetical protein
MTDLKWEDIMKMESASFFLRRTDASPKKPSPLITIGQLKDIANDEIQKYKSLANKLGEMLESISDRLPYPSAIILSPQEEIKTRTMGGPMTVTKEYADEYNEMINIINEWKLLK